MTLDTFQQWQVANGHHVTETIDGDEVHAPELCPLCECQDAGEHEGDRFFFGARTVCKRHAIARGIY